MKIKIGFFSTIFIVFIVFLILKLTNVIDWNWIWITCPLWWWLPILILFKLVCESTIYLCKRELKIRKDKDMQEKKEFKKFKFQQ